MNASEIPQGEDARAILQASFQSAWQELLANDDNEPDLDRLAAYVEHRLSPVDESLVQNELAQSSLALEIASLLSEDPTADRRESALSPTTSRTKGVIKSPAAIRLRTRAKWRIGARLAVAASLLVATAAIIFGWTRDQKLKSLNREVVALRSQTEDLAQLNKQFDSLKKEKQALAESLLVAEKEHLSLLTAKARQPYLSGVGSVELLRLAMLDVGRPREVKALTNEESTSVGRAVQRVADAAAHLAPDSPQSKLETAAALIQAGDFERATKVLELFGPIEKLSSGDRAHAQNVRAGLFALQAELLPLIEARPRLAEAESMFRQAAKAGSKEAWLNLAFLLVQEQKLAEAKAAAAKYLEHEPDQRRRTLVEQTFK